MGRLTAMQVFVANFGKSHWTPESATQLPSSAMINPEFSGQVIKQALINRCGFNPDELENVGDFSHWAQTGAGLVRIHLLRFTPKADILALGGELKPMSLRRGSVIVGGGRPNTHIGITSTLGSKTSVRS